MNHEIKKMEQCDICKKTLESDMAQYTEFVKAFLSDEKVNKAANALLPFDGDVPGCLHFLRSDNLIKGMGATVMRMELSPALYSLGIILKIGESEFGEEVTSVAYISACKSLDEYRQWIETADFKKTAYNEFSKIIDLYFFPQETND